MISMAEFLQTTGYRITEGGEYHWNCYGSHAHSLSCWNGVHGAGGWSANMVFDTQTQTVYEVGVCDYTHDRAYRMINPDFEEAYQDEAKHRGISETQAWDDVDYIDLDVDSDWIQKALAIVAGQTYDTRVQIEIKFSDAELIQYMKAAHDLDITFNQFIERALTLFIEQVDRDPVGARELAQSWVSSDRC